MVMIPGGNWVRFFAGKIAKITIINIIILFQRAYDILPILTLGSFFQKWSICRECSTSVE